MLINEDLLFILKSIYGSVPARTPKRLEIIFECVREQLVESWNIDIGQQILINLGDEYGQSLFKADPSTIKRLDEYFKASAVIDFNLVLRNKLDVILLPIHYFCCDKPIKLDARHAQITLYTDNGVRKGRSYHGKCKMGCGKTYYNGFIHDKETNMRWFDDNQGEFLIFTSGVGFSYSLLKSVKFQVFLGAVSFDTCATIYNNIHGLFSSPNALNAKRLEYAFFIQLITSCVKKVYWHRNPKSKEVDVEKIAKDSYQFIAEIIDKKWLQHECDEVGCRNRFIVVDGNEKMFRLVCKADRSKVETKCGPTEYNLCIKNPIRGNQHKTASKYCSDHLNGNTSQIIPQCQLDLRPITRSLSLSMPNVLVSGEGCKKSENIERFHSRTAGMIYLFRPCGIRLTHCEMFTAERLSQVFTCLIDCFGECPDESQLRGIVYDRCCDLDPFITRLAKNGNRVADNYSNLKFIVDIFHVEKHTLQKCTLGNPECKYHPNLPEFSFLIGMNTEVAEQSFSKINPHKFSTRKMCYAKRLLYLKFLDDIVNQQLVLKMKK